MLLKEQLKRINDVEAEAERLVEDGRNAAARILAEAGDKAGQAEAKIMADASERLDKARALRSGQTDVKIAKIMRETDRKLHELRREVEPRIERAAALILEEATNTSGV